MEGENLMAHCTDCGSIYNNADIGKHACDPLDIPAASFEIPKGKTLTDKIALRTR